MRAPQSPTLLAARRRPTTSVPHQSNGPPAGQQRAPSRPASKQTTQVKALAHLLALSSRHHPLAACPGPAKGSEPLPRAWGAHWLSGSSMQSSPGHCGRIPSLRRLLSFTLGASGASFGAVSLALHALERTRMLLTSGSRQARAARPMMTVCASPRCCATIHSPWESTTMNGAAAR